MDAQTDVARDTSTDPKPAASGPAEVARVDLFDEVIELTISTQYVPAWGLWEGVRELVQNGLDAIDDGLWSNPRVDRKMCVSRDENTGEVTIRTDNARLTRPMLLLGTTTKAGKQMRGQFGEGMKLAWLTLCRAGVGVTVRSGRELWRPFIEESTAFKTDVIKVEVQQHDEEVDVIEIRLTGIALDAWEQLQQNMLDIPGLPATQLTGSDRIKMGMSSILTHERFQSKLYSGGLFVCKLPDEYVYGYDLMNLKLDRDRKMADPWSLAAHVQSILTAAIASLELSPAQVYDAVEVDKGEARQLERYYSINAYSGSLSTAMAATFHERHGDDTLPVTTAAEKTEAEHIGIRSVLVTRPMSLIIQAEEGDLIKQKRQMSLRAKVEFELAQLNTVERTNLDWAYGLLQKVRPGFDTNCIRIVTFVGDTIANGTFSCAQNENYEDVLSIMLSRKILSERQALIATLVHEWAHIAGMDGTVSHERMIEEIFADIVVLLSNVEPKVGAANNTQSDLVTTEVL